jgi:hypothetical protein
LIVQVRSQKSYFPTVLEESMKKTLLTLSLLLASMLAVNAYAQKAAPGEDRAAPSASATKEQKAAAKDKRKAEGATAAKSGADSDKSETTASGKKTSKAEKDAAKANRKTAGAEATKAPKVDSSPTKP